MVTNILPALLSAVSAENESKLSSGIREFIFFIADTLFRYCTNMKQQLILWGILVLVSLVFASLAAWVSSRYLHKIFPDMKVCDLRLGKAVQYPVFWLVALTGIYFSCAVLALPPKAAFVISRLYFIVITLLFLRAFLKFLNVIAEKIRCEAVQKNSIYTRLLLSMIIPILKFLLWTVTILFLLDNVFHFKIGTLLAGAGIASMAVAFAAQNTIANLFGALSLILDRPFLPGDRIQLDGKEGTVEQIGLRSIRLRAPDGTLWCIPNKTVADSAIVNFTQRPFSRYTFIVNLNYDTTPEQIRKGKQLLQEILENHPLISVSCKPPRIFFAELGAYSLDLHAVCFFQTANPAEVIKARDEINFRILQSFNENGLDIAFPTQSLRIESMPSKES